MTEHTVEELLLAVGDRLDELRKRDDAINRACEHMSKRLDQMDAREEQLADLLEEVRQREDLMVDALVKMRNGQSEAMHALSEQFATADQNHATAFKRYTGVVGGIFDRVVGRISKVEERAVACVVQTTKGFTAASSKLAQTHDVLSTLVATNNNQIKSLQTIVPLLTSLSTEQGQLRECVEGVRSDMERRRCAFCKRGHAKMKCVCGVHYCGPACQQKDWRAHKAVCQAS